MQFFSVTYGVGCAIWSSSPCDRLHPLASSSLWTLCSRKLPLIKNCRIDSMKQEKELQRKTSGSHLVLSCYLFPFFTSHPCFVCYCADMRSGCGWNESRALQSPVSTDGIETNFYVVRKSVIPETANHTSTCLESFWELLGGFCFSS
jgi:hypothetical protein